MSSVANGVLENYCKVGEHKRYPSSLVFSWLNWMWNLMFLYIDVKCSKWISICTMDPKNDFMYYFPYILIMLFCKWYNYEVRSSSKASDFFFSGMGADRLMRFGLKYVCTLCECVTEMAALYGTQNSSGGSESEECFWYLKWRCFRYKNSE